MPRKKLARRFDPRGGVSEGALAVEATYLAREVDDSLVYSLSELREKLDERRTSLDRRQQELEQLLRGLDERRQLAVLCTLYRDFNHMVALYGKFLGDAGVPEAAAAGGLRPAPPAPLPFKEWLFEK